MGSNEGKSLGCESDLIWFVCCRFAFGFSGPPCSFYTCVFLFFLPLELPWGIAKSRKMKLRWKWRKHMKMNMNNMKKNKHDFQSMAAWDEHKLTLKVPTCSFEPHSFMIRSLNQHKIHPEHRPKTKVIFQPPHVAESMLMSWREDNFQFSNLTFRSFNPLSMA